MLDGHRVLVLAALANARSRDRCGRFLAEVIADGYAMVFSVGILASDASLAFGVDASAPSARERSSRRVCVCSAKCPFERDTSHMDLDAV